MSDSHALIDDYRGTPIIGVSAASGTGKTTLLRAVIPLLVTRGIRVGCVKHTHHPFNVDQPGKDSYELRAAGASQTLIGAPGRYALIVERTDTEDPGLLELVGHLDVEHLDLVLVEGFRVERIPKLIVHRAELSAQPEAIDDPAVLAVVSNAPRLDGFSGTLIDIDKPQLVADFIATCIGARSRT